MPKDESVINPPSHCPKCNTRLRIPDLVPLFSFLILGRKCRYCGEPIGWRYFTVELITGLFLVALHMKYQLSVDFFVFALFSAALIAVFFIDLDHWIIPDQLSVFAMVLGISRDILGLVTGEEGHVLMRIPVPFTSIDVPMLWSVAGLLICGAIFYGIAIFG
ncbi:MAG TPA: prepilin peptidase, partial [Armatimonadota bacterium]|nr:prepilin peptidase [Armatimonadota bacterium]